MEGVRKALPKATDEFGKRWLEMMNVHFDREISADELRAITLNVVRKQRDDKTLRRDRFVPPEKESQTQEEFETREFAIIANKSDAAVLDEMEEVEREAGLDMSEPEAAWFKYMTTGGDKPGMAKNLPECEVPF